MDLVEETTEACSSAERFESAHGSVSLFNTSVILLQMVIQIAVGPMRDLLSEDMAYSTRVGVAA
jgi:hypothetical protein